MGRDKNPVKHAIVVCALALLAAAPKHIGAAVFTDVKFKEKLIAGKLNPTQMEVAPDGRVFVNFKDGRIRVVKNDSLLPQPFATVKAEYHNEQGLIGIAFHPGFPDTPYVYVYYVVPDGNGEVRHSRVVRFTAAGDTAVPNSVKTILDLDPLSDQTLHISGAIHFGPDRKLYIAAGNSGVHENSQSIATVLGKILRINADGTIPQDNPFVSSTTGKNQAIMALGLRNPFSTSFNPATGHLFIGDVQDGGPEVIQEMLPGSNYGYPNYQGGTLSGNPFPANSPGTLKMPVATYPHPAACGAITSSAWYSPAKVHQFPEKYRSLFYFADFCGGWIKTMDPNNNFALADFATGLVNPVDIKFSPVDGSMYYLLKNGGGNDTSTNGQLYRVTYGDGVTAALPHAGIARAAGEWHPALAHDGRIAWREEAQQMDVRSIDGRNAFTLARAATGAGEAELPPFARAGMFLVRFR